MDELKLRAIEEVRKLITPETPPGGFTAREYASTVGIHLETARKQLKDLSEKGLLERVKVDNKIYFLLKKNGGS